MLNLRSVDLNLLPVFEAAYEERSLSRAAQRLAMTQSAVSHAMTRLRGLFRDPLFIRQARGVVPTPLADMVYAKLRGALGSVRESVTEMQGFDPRTSRREFFVAIAHPLGPIIAVRLRERLAHVAPQVRVTFSTRSRPVELERALREGRVDAAVDWLSQTGDQFREAVAFEDGLVVMARHGHSALRQRSFRRVLESAQFVSLRPRVEGDHPVPALRQWQRLNPTVALDVSEYIEVLMVAGQSELLALAPRSMQQLARATFNLRVLPSSPKTPPIPIKLIWHRGRDADPAHVFLRQHLLAGARQVVLGK
jgi:LysR family transcriptional regulator, transcriptional activator for leuABCD operon